MNIEKPRPPRKSGTLADGLNCQIHAIAELLTRHPSRDGFDLGELRILSSALCEAHTQIEDEIVRRIDERAYRANYPEDGAA